MSKKDKKFRKMEKNAEKPAVLFSFDGTILNTEPAIIASYEHVLSMFGHETKIPHDIELELLDAPASDMIKKYFPKEDVRKCTEEYENYQRYHLTDLIQPQTGALDLLDWLSKKGFRMGILSNRTRSSVVEILEHLHIVSYFDVIIGRGVGEERSTADDILLACRLMHTHNAILIGDSADDMDAGHQTGCYTIGFTSNSEKSASIVSEMPDFATGDLSQIIKLLSGEPAWLAYTVYQPEELQAMADAAALKEQKKAEKKEKKAAKKEKKKTDHSEEKKSVKEDHKKKKSDKAAEDQTESTVKKHKAVSKKKSEKTSDQKESAAEKKNRKKK